MSDEFWISFGFLCGQSLGECRGEAWPHVERVMKELVEKFPEQMYPLRRYLE